LLVFIDDATGKLMQLRFCERETSSYSTVCAGISRPTAVPLPSTRQDTVFRMNRDAQGGQGMTRSVVLLAELNIEIICANSIQLRAGGTVNRTLQTAGEELRLDVSRHGMATRSSLSAASPTTCIAG